jgi:DNA-binding PadR family transcriptional regulator
MVFLAMLQRVDFMYLLRQSGLSRGNLSVQMGKLQEAALISVDKSFVDNRPRTTYALSEKGRDALRDYKRTMEGVLAALPD